MKEKQGEKKGWTGTGAAAAVLAVIILAAILAIWAMAPPKASPADAPLTEFSAGRALRLVEEIAREPHPLGSPAHDEVRDAILRMWRDLGFEPEIQAGIHYSAGNRMAARVENIIARLPGAKPVSGGALMLAAHYDSVTAAPGAADDAAGVAVLLETARALKAGPPPARDVVFLVTDAEEDGLDGAGVFQSESPLAADVGLVLNFEARGTSGPSLMFETSDGNGRLIAAFASVPHPRAYSFASMLYRRMPNDTDLSVWLRAGIQGLNFAFIGRPYDYHTAGDNSARLDLRSLQHHGSSALALARRFGNDGVPARAEGNAIHFSFFGDLLIRYSKTAAVLLVVLIAALLAAAASCGIRRKTLRPGGLWRGALFMIAAPPVSGALAYGFFLLVRSAFGSWLPPGPWLHSRTLLLATAALAAAATIFLHGLLRGRKSGLETAFGAGVLGLVLAAAVTVWAAEASYLAAVPAFFLAAGVLAWAAFGKREGDRETAPPAWAAAATAAGVVIIAAPVTFLLFETMFLSPLIGAVLAALVSLMLSMTVPAIEILRQGKGRLLPALSAGIFVVLAVVSALTVRFTAEIPLLASVQYVQDFDAGEAYWVSPTISPDAWTERAAGGDFRAGHPFPDSVRRPEAFSFREAPVSAILPPDVRVVEDRESGGTRLLRLRIVSPRGGRLIVASAQTGQILSAAVEGRPISVSSEEPDRVSLRFLNPGPDGFELTLEATPADPVRLSLRETNPGFPDLPGFILPPAPPAIRPHRIETVLTRSFVFPPATG